MADRPPPEAPQVRCAHAPSLDGLRRLQVVRVRDGDADQPRRWSLRTCPDRPLAPPAEAP